jgi:hypothetical protein
MHPRRDERTETVTTATREICIVLYFGVPLTARGEPGHNRFGCGREDTAIQAGAAPSPQPTLREQRGISSGAKRVGPDQAGMEHALIAFLAIGAAVLTLGAWMVSNLSSRESN